MDDTDRASDTPGATRRTNLLTTPPLRTSPLKRDRWTNARLAALDAALIDAAEDEAPCTVRRRADRLPYRWITDGARYYWSATTWADIDAAVDALPASYRKALCWISPRKSRSSPRRTPSAASSVGLPAGEMCRSASSG